MFDLAVELVHDAEDVTMSEAHSIHDDYCIFVDRPPAQDLFPLLSVQLGFSVPCGRL